MWNGVQSAEEVGVGTGRKGAMAVPTTDVMLVSVAVRSV